MTEPHGSETPAQMSSDEDRMSALFVQLILQQTNMAMMLMGKIAHPESGQVYKDVEAARLFIDQLEMLESKTRGNLTKQESGLLKQSLMNLRLAFVEAVESEESKKEPATGSESKGAAPAPQPATDTTTSAAASSEDEHRKKFSKKY